MLLKILLTTLMVTSFGCKEQSAPRLPYVKVFTPIFVFNKDESIDWDKSYIYGTSYHDPHNMNHHENISIKEFLTGETTKEKPRLIRGNDFVKLSDWTLEVTDWMNANCEVKE